MNLDDAYDTGVGIGLSNRVISKFKMEFSRGQARATKYIFTLIFALIYGSSSAQKAWKPLHITPNQTIERPAESQKRNHKTRLIASSLA